MTVRRLLLLAVTSYAASACVSPSDIRRVETQVALSRAEAARQDSVRAAQLAQLTRMQQQIMDSLAATRRAVASARADMANDLYTVQQQLVQLGELAGQSQQRLTELRTQLEARQEQIATAAPDSTAAAAPAGAGAGGASADQVYEASLQQLRRGSTSTARAGFRELVQQFPTSARVPDALYFIGQSFAAENADSAAAYYQQVADRHAESARAPAALYSLGLLAEGRKNTAAAREAYNRVVQRYPRSDEAALARERLRTLGR